MKTTGLFFIFATLLIASSVRAVNAVSDEGERQRIALERQQSDAEFSRADVSCRARFVVAACLDEARKQHRNTHERLRLQLNMLDEAQRKQRAAERVDAIRAKVSAEEADRREVEAQSRRQAVEQPAASAPSGSRARAVDVAKPVKPAPAPHPRSEPRNTKRPMATDAQRVSEYQARQRAAQAHRDEVERRNAARAASGKKPAAPLPVPPVMPVMPLMPTKPASQP